MGKACISIGSKPVPHDPDSAEALRRVELPLRDLEYNIEAYLLANGARLDTGTRRFLAQLRDALGNLSLTAACLGEAR